MTHYLQIADNSLQMETIPAGTSKQVKKWSHFIKPAAPTENTIHKISHNTLTWVRTNMLILQQPCTEGTIAIMETTTEYKDLEWQWNGPEEIQTQCD